MNLDELKAWNDNLAALLAEAERGLATWNEAVADHLSILTSKSYDTGFDKGFNAGLMSGKVACECLR